ncbi:hypothetical protein DL546_002289 [Coniochaeta pulveracea]|uniref:ATPase inhibitor, mitochondrial n=1 Tax=Coniochaeta pulveracea TaxID=177199 RepID=A0A420XYH9_9PEZI|nr:hypothetical protein DL546_002289 [Coniochaeta pulveracea]
MLSTVTKFARPSVLSKTTRAALSTTATRMAAGDTGAVRPSGGGDAFQKREKAAEDYAVRQREKERLLELRKKLHEQQAHLKQLSDHIDEITKEQGGEKN